jgi:hypothetical protein
MSCRICIAFISVCLLLCSIQLHAQTNNLATSNLSSVNINEIPDSDIKSYLQRAKENGISEQDMYRILSEKGLPGEELDKLAERIKKINTEAPDNKGRCQCSQNKK